MINSIKAKFQSKDQNHQDEQTIYWFDVSGTDEEYGVYGVAESCGEVKFLDDEGYPCNTQDEHIRVIFVECIVTDEMRNDY